MTTMACPGCGTQTDAGTVCTRCGTPVSTDTPVAATAGYASYWEGILGRLQQAAAPKYEVHGILGYGGMAGVYSADEPRLGRKVAIKVMSPALMMDPKLVDRFVQEARTIALLNHSNIVTIFEVDERQDLHWFTMTYVAGRTLGQVMAESAVALPPHVVRAWLYQIGDALAYAHLNGVIHRDIKPSNVLIDLRGNALVTDFGIAKVADGEAGLTRTGMLVGTPTYMSPEQCSSGDLTGASDQYSLGAVAYQMLTGQPPFAGPTLAVLQAHVVLEPAPIMDLRPECPPELAQAVHRMLEKRAEHRFPTLSEAIAAAGAAPPGADSALRDDLARLAAPTATVTLQPQIDVMREGDTQPLQLDIRDVAGREVAGRIVEWSSSTPLVATPVAGTINALSPGTTRIAVTCGPAQAALSITVEPDPIGDIDVAPRTATVEVGRETVLTTTVLDLDGTPLDRRIVLWSTSDPGIAEVSSTGVVTGRTPGSAVIAARTGGKYAAASITVNEASITADASATPAVFARAGSSTGAPAAAPSLEVTPESSIPSETAVAEATAGTHTGGRPKRDLTRPLMGVAAALIVLALLGTLLSSGTEPPVATAPDNVPPSTPMSTDDAPAVDIETTPDGGDPAGPVSDPDVATDPTAPTDPPARDQPPATRDQPTAPRAGSLAVAGPLPAGAEVTARNAGGRVWRIGERSTELAPGTYTLEFRAPGHEPDRRNFVVREGQAERWQPSVRRIEVPAPVAQPAPAQPQPTPPVPAPERDVAADQAAVDRAVRDYAAAFNRRDADRVVPLLPADIRANWARVLGSRDVTDLSATLTSVATPRVNGDSALVEFRLDIVMRNQNRPVDASLQLTGTAARTADGWRLVSLERRP